MDNSTQVAYHAPRVRIRDVASNGDIYRITVELDDRLADPIRRPLSPATLYRDNDPGIALISLHRLVSLAGRLASFETVVERRPELSQGEIVVFQSWWTPDQLEVARSIKAPWQRTRFTPHDTVAYRPDGSVEFLPGGWNHEHCKLCFERIDKEKPYGYTDDGDRWLCEKCYEEHILSGFGAQLGDQV